jgi:hypothetical protein
MAVSIKIPLVEMAKNQATGKLEYQRREILVRVNTSVLANYKWERTFQAEKDYDLVHAVGLTQINLKNLQKNPKIGTALIQSLEVVYCFIESPELPTFVDFLNGVSEENLSDVIDKITAIIEEVNSVSGKN